MLWEWHWGVDDRIHARRGHVCATRDRKVRILLRLRKELTNLPIAPAGEDDGARMETIDEALASDISSQNSQGVETVENLRMKERCGNVIENKGSESAGINRQEAENVNFLRGRISDPLGPEFCAACREVRSEA